MSNVGVSNGKTTGQLWNRVHAFRTADGKIEFRLYYEDPETCKVRFTGKGATRRVDEIIFSMDDIQALAALSSVAADAIIDVLNRQESKARREAERSTT